MIENIFIEEKLPKELSKQELIEHVNRYKLGSQESRDILIKHNIKLVFYQIYKRFYETDYDKKDLVSIGIIGLIKAVDTYEFNKSEFSTYAVKCINNEILQFLRKKHINDMSIDEVIYQDENGDEMRLSDIICDESKDYTSKYEEKEMIIAIRKYIDILDERSKKIIKLYFGFENDKEYTQREIGELIGINQSQINRIIKKSLSIIKQKLINDGLIDKEIPKHNNEENNQNETQEELNQNEKDNSENIYYSDRHKRALINKILNKQTEDLSPEERNDLVEISKIIIKNMDNKTNKNILMLYYGFFDKKEYNYDEIISQMQFSKTGIGKIIQRSTDKIVECLLTTGIINTEHQINKEILQRTLTFKREEEQFKNEPSLIKKLV